MPEAWAFFSAVAPSYRRTATHWVVSAKRPETRERRLAQLIEDSAAGRRLKHLTPYPRSETSGARSPTPPRPPRGCPSRTSPPPAPGMRTSSASTPPTSAPADCSTACPSGEFALFESTGEAAGTHTQIAFEVPDIEATVAELRDRGVAFEAEITDIDGNYPSKNARGERATWFRDCAGNLIGVGELVSISD